MDDRLKKRLIGAAVLMSLLIIFVPMLIEQGRIDNRIDENAIPPRPEVYFPPVNLDLPEQTPATASASTPAAPTAPAIASKPAPPASRPTKPVAAKPASKPASHPKPRADDGKPNAWVIQVASFTDRQRAEKLAARLRKAGFSTFINSAWAKGARRYRVRVGPELDLDRARRMARSIERKIHLKGTVQRHR